MFCAMCGHGNADEAIFCNKCGKRIVPEGAPAGKTVEDAAAGVSSPAASPAEPAEAVPATEVAVAAPALAASQPSVAPASGVAEPSPPPAPSAAPPAAFLTTQRATTTTPTEEVIWAGAASWKSFLNLWWLLAFLAFGVGVPVVSFMVLLPFLSALVLVPVVAFAAYAWFRRTTRYRLTTERITTVRGILSRSSDDIQLVRVEDVQFEQSLLNRVFNVGRITVLSTDKTTPRLDIEGVPDPSHFKERLWGLVRERRRNTVMMEQLNQ